MGTTEKLGKMPLIRFSSLTLIPILIIYTLPNIWWGFTLKAVLIFWITVTIRAAFAPMWERYGTLGAFVLWNTILFVSLLWFDEPSWVRYALSFLLVLSFATQLHHIDKTNKK